MFHNVSSQGWLSIKQYCQNSILFNKGRLWMFFIFLCRVNKGHLKGLWVLVTLWCHLWWFHNNSKQRVTQTCDWDEVLNWTFVQLRDRMLLLGEMQALLSVAGFLSIFLSNCTLYHHGHGLLASIRSYSIKINAQILYVRTVLYRHCTVWYWTYVRTPYCLPWAT